MVKLELSTDEASMLSELLASALSELHMEIGHTEKREWREELKKRKVFMTHLLERLELTTA